MINRKCCLDRSAPTIDMSLMQTHRLYHGDCFLLPLDVQIPFYGCSDEQTLNYLGLGLELGIVLGLNVGFRLESGLD